MFSFLKKSSNTKQQQVLPDPWIGIASLNRDLKHAAKLSSRATRARPPKKPAPAEEEENTDTTRMNALWKKAEDFINGFTNMDFELLDPKGLYGRVCLDLGCAKTGHQCSYHRSIEQNGGRSPESSFGSGFKLSDLSDGGSMNGRRRAGSEDPPSRRSADTLSSQTHTPRSLTPPSSRADPGPQAATVSGSGSSSSGTWSMTGLTEMWAQRKERKAVLACGRIMVWGVRSCGNIVGLGNALSLSEISPQPEISEIPVLPPQQPSNSWACRVCTLYNPMRNARCSACNTIRPAPQFAPSAPSPVPAPRLGNTLSGREQAALDGGGEEMSAWLGGLLSTSMERGASISRVEQRMAKKLLSRCRGTEYHPRSEKYSMSKLCTGTEVNRDKIKGRPRQPPRPSGEALGIEAPDHLAPPPPISPRTGEGAEVIFLGCLSVLDFYRFLHTLMQLSSNLVADTDSDGEAEAEKGEQEECSICMDNVVERVLPCTHAFCKECLGRWGTGEKVSCPLCRRTVTVGDTHDDSWDLLEGVSPIDVFAEMMASLEGMPIRSSDMTPLAESEQ